MQFTSTLLAAILATAALAAPLETRASSWTMQKFTRTCTGTSTCHYTYSINLNDGSKATSCAYDVKSGSASAQDTSYAVTCGAFVISSGWSGQFGPGNGFSTLAVKEGK